MGLLVSLEEVFETDDSRHFGFDLNGKLNRNGVLQLDSQRSLYCVRGLNNRHFDCHFDLCLFFFPYSKSYLLIILESLVAAYRKYIFIEIVELIVVAGSDDSEKVRRAVIIIRKYFLFQTYADVHLVY